MFCTDCGKQISDNATICMGCGVPTKKGEVNTASPKGRTAYVLLAIFIGQLGIHNFYAGYITKGIIQLVVSLVGCFLIVPVFAMWVWAVVEACTVKKDASGKAFV